MGSIATLSVGNLELDWSKNYLINSHSKLFVAGDKRLTPYYYADEVVKDYDALVASLFDVKPRLELLGYTLRGIKSIYNSAIEAYPEYLDNVDIDFSTFAKVMRNVDVTNVARSEYDGHDFDLGEYVEKEIFSYPEFNKIHKLLDIGTDVGSFFENLDPYIQLRLLMENPKNLDLELIWRYRDVVEGGWASEADTFEGLQRGDHFLVVTEGSSDSFIIRRAFELLMPRIADFFRFIDMEKGYPFTGTGNLFKFCRSCFRSVLSLGSMPW